MTTACNVNCNKGVKSTFDSYHFIAKAKRRLDPFTETKFPKCESMIHFDGQRIVKFIESLR